MTKPTEKLPPASARGLYSKVRVPPAAPPHVGHQLAFVLGILLLISVAVALIAVKG